VCAQAGGPGAVVLATDHASARSAGALTDDPVAAAVALAAATVAGEQASSAVPVALGRLRTVEVPTDADLEPALDALLGGPAGDVLTAVPAPGVDAGRLQALVRARDRVVEVVLLAPAGGGPAWRLGLD
jgi:hypothetical protein